MTQIIFRRRNPMVIVTTFFETKGIGCGSMWRSTMRLACPARRGPIDGELGDCDTKKWKEKGVTPCFVSKAERDQWEAKVAPHKDKTLAGFGEFGHR